MSRYDVSIDGHQDEVELSWLPTGGSELIVRQGERKRRVVVPGADLPLQQMEWVIVDNIPHELAFDDDLRWVKGSRGLHRVEVTDKDAVVTRPRSGDGRVKAPIPGLITRILVTVGQEVETGQPLLMLEAMKMENEIRSPCTGRVARLPAAAGKGVMRGELLAEVVP